jgi:hypothetical protein
VWRDVVAQTRKFLVGLLLPAWQLLNFGDDTVWDVLRIYLPMYEERQPLDAQYIWPSSSQASLLLKYLYRERYPGRHGR